jgi:prevent-host-death family protein
MAKSARNVSFAEFGENPSRVARRVRGSKRPILLTERGRAQAVLMSVEAFEQGEREREILRALARGEREIASGVGFSLDEVLADAAKVLRPRRKWESASRRPRGASS